MAPPPAAAAGGAASKLKDAADTTAFRAKEKQYQLHKQQQMRYRGGKLRGWKLVDRGTDFADVVDLHGPTPSIPATIHQHAVDGCPGPVYTFDQHPGLVYIPSYLAASEQLELCRAAVQEYHEPPARTNHSVHHGPLPGLWDAARAGLLLASAAPTAGTCSHELAGSSPPSGYAGTPPVMGLSPRAAPTRTPAPAPQHLPPQPGQEETLLAPTGGASPTAAVEAACDPANASAGTDGPVDYANGAGHSNSGSEAEGEGEGKGRGEAGAGSPCCSSEVWSSEGTGPPAQRLLSKLRWATLGPPYNWTTRTYELHAPHRPLPPRLHRLADDVATIFNHLALPLVQPPEGPWPLPTPSGNHVPPSPTPPNIATTSSSTHPNPTTTTTSLTITIEAPSSPTSNPSATPFPSSHPLTPIPTDAPAVVLNSHPLTPISTHSPAFVHPHSPSTHSCHPEPMRPTISPTTTNPVTNPVTTSTTCFVSETNHASFNNPTTTPAQPPQPPHHQLPSNPSTTPSSPASHPLTPPPAQLHPPAPTPYRQQIPYHPDAAIVNYYREGDTLGGHKDDAEVSMAHPLLSISLGCRAVFLMGGTSKAVPPTPLMLHSGDVLVLSGEARRCYHGVPRVLAGTLPPELRPERVEAQYRAVSEYLMGGRINISIRTVT